MDAMTPGLTGHKGLRGEILLEIKRSQPVTAKRLADIFGVSANAVRRHLKELEAEGLVEYGREQRGTGAPTHTYRLSLRGEGLFPTQYGETLTDVLSFIAQTNGREAVREMFAERFRTYADRRKKSRQSWSCCRNRGTWRPGRWTKTGYDWPSTTVR
jgi:DeoR family suf operon transcriptional repressor